jgi:hypothetical protein
MLTLLLACTGVERASRVEPTFLEVTLADGVPTGSAESPLPFSSDEQPLSVTVRTLDVNGEPTPFDGDLTVKVRPGVLEQDPFVSVEDGVWSGDVVFRNGFGPTRVWFTDEGDKDEDSGRPVSFAVGVTPTLHYRFPTIAQMQASEDIGTNQLEGEFARLRVDDRTVIVTAREASGFWATDVSDAPGSGNSVYVYTFSRPSDDYAVGARLGLLAGINQEYLDSTQLSYPTLTVTGETAEVPDASVLTACDDTTMEGLEAARVQVAGGTVPADFGPGSEDYEDYTSYGQWPVTYGDCTIYVESGVTVPDFDPVAVAGQSLPVVEGMLKQIHSEWVIVVLDAADLVPPAATTLLPVR